ILPESEIDRVRAAVASNSPAVVIGRAHCRHVPAQAAVANSSPVVAIGRALCRRVLGQGVVANNFQVAVARAVVAPAVAAAIDQAKAALASSGDRATIDPATCRQIVLVAIGGRRIMPTASTTGTTGKIIATTIGRISTTIGAIAGPTIGMDATTGS